MLTQAANVYLVTSWCQLLHGVPEDEVMRSGWKSTDAYDSSRQSRVYSEEQDKAT